MRRTGAAEEEEGDSMAAAARLAGCGCDEGRRRGIWIHKQLDLLPSLAHA